MKQCGKAKCSINSKALGGDTSGITSMFDGRLLTAEGFLLALRICRILRVARPFIFRRLRIPAQRPCRFFPLARAQIVDMLWGADPPVRRALVDPRLES